MDSVIPNWNVSIKYNSEQKFNEILQILAVNQLKYKKFGSRFVMVLDPNLVVNKLLAGITDIEIFVQ
jgi:hypothetical protein